MHWPGLDGWLSDGDADSYHWGLKSYRQAVVEKVDALVGVRERMYQCRGNAGFTGVSGEGGGQRARRQDEDEALLFDCDMEHLRRYPVC